MSKQVSFCNDKLLIYMPDEFEMFEDNINDNNLLHIYACAEKKAFIMLNEKNNILSNGQIEPQLISYYQLYCGTIPGIKDARVAIKKLENGSVIGLLYYISSAVQRQLFNYLVLMSINDKEVVMTMHCSAEDSPVLGAQFMRILDSISICVA